MVHFQSSSMRRAARLVLNDTYLVLFGTFSVTAKGVPQGFGTK
jgi:hypothetical protein